MSGYANPHALVSAAWLAEHLEDPAVRVVEVDEDATAYDKGHIPNAVAWHWARDLHHPVQRDYATGQELAALLGRSGVAPGTTVVLYGANNNWFATYAYWLLAYRGFDGVRLLDGGRKKWELDKRALTTARPNVHARTHPVPAKDRPALRIFRDDVLHAVRRASFIDVRSPQEYSGEKLAPDHLPQEQPYVGGHVPGAANVPWAKAANDDGTFKSADELRTLYAGAGIRSDATVITYCRIGERSSHTWFALRELLGYEHVLNYDGSWTEYGSLVGAPVERSFVHAG